MSSLVESPVVGVACVCGTAASARTSPGSQSAEPTWDQAVLGGPGCRFLLWFERFMCRVNQQVSGQCSQVVK